MNEKLKAYRDAWKRLEEEIEKKTSWGKIELKKRMQDTLIECMEVYLED